MKKKTLFLLIFTLLLNEFVKMSVTLKFRPVKRKFTTKMVSDKIQNLTGKINTLNNGLQRGVCVDPKIDPTGETPVNDTAKFLSLVCHLGNAYQTDLEFMVNHVNETHQKSIQIWNNTINITEDISSQREDHIVNVGLVYDKVDNVEISTSLKGIASHAFETGFQAIKGFPAFMIAFVQKLSSMISTGNTNDVNSGLNGPLKRLIAFTKSKTILEKIEYEVISLQNEVKTLAETLFNPLIDHLTEDLISLNDLAEIIAMENIELALMGKRIKFKASECFNGNVPISRIFLNHGDDATLILVMYFPLEDLDQTHNYDPRNPLVMNLEKKQHIPEFLFSKTYYCVLLFASVVASIITYFTYKCTKKSVRKCRRTPSIEDAGTADDEMSEMM